jgi:hypothetical protein
MSDPGPRATGGGLLIEAYGRLPTIMCAWLVKKITLLDMVHLNIKIFVMTENYGITNRSTF